MRNIWLRGKSMFMCPEGWREWRNGDLLTYVPREGIAHCVITYIERVSPVRSLPYLLYRVLDDEPEFVRTETFQIARFVSAEGEYGARIVVKGESRGAPIALIVAGLFTEDFSTRLVGRVEVAYLDKYVDLITNLAQHDKLDLGIRRRRIAFQPPKDWHPVTTDLGVSLFPPTYPKPRCVITVYPAEPITTRNPKDVIEQHDGRMGVAPAQELSITKTYTHRNLHGEISRSVHPLPGGAGKMVRHLAVLSDNRYWYAAKLEALEQPGLEAYVDTLAMVANSIESIPAPTPNIVAPTQFAWID